jgi:hypothetical protein
MRSRLVHNSGSYYRRSIRRNGQVARQYVGLGLKGKVTALFETGGGEASEPAGLIPTQQTGANRA